MKIVSWVLLFCLTANVFASAANMQELEKSLDDYQYSMTVDWDQKDKAFYSQKTEAFFAKLGNLMKDGQVSQAEVMALVEKKVADKNVVSSIKAQLANVSSVASSSELANILRDNADKFYTKGASWNGDTTLTVGIVAVVVGVIGYAIWFAATHKCVAYSQQYVCNSYGNGGYYDGYGGGYYGSNYGYSSSTYCGYQDVCTEYVKK
jgi:hypothetical protein